MKTNDSPKKTAYLQRNIAAFQEETKERLAELETALMELEESPTDTTLLDSAFRAMHTIKGSGGMFGFDNIVDFTHDIETVFDKVRDGTISLTKDLIELTLKAHDQIAKMLDDSEEPIASDLELREEIKKKFNSYLPQKEDSPRHEIPIVKEPEQEPEQKEEKEQKDFFTYRIRFKPSLDLFATGTNPLLLLGELQEMGETKITAHPEQIPQLDVIDSEHCYVWWDIILSTSDNLNSVKDIFIFVEDMCDISIDIIDSDASLEEKESHKKIGEILIEKGDIDKDAFQEVLDNRELIGQKLTKQGLVQPSQVQSALVEQDVLKSNREKRSRIDSTSSIRVSSAKLDKLVDLVGELVTAQARLSQIANTNSDATVLSVAEEIERLTGELRDSTMSVRMLTFGTTFNKFKRLIRDLSMELGKDVVLLTEGADTELDKNVIEQLNDPLVHLLRNALDHGIEFPDDRLRSGKEKQGIIKLSAYYAGTQVLIKIQDDGVGMDPVAIRNNAVQKGLIGADSKLSDKDCYFLIFEPGFSTAEKVTNVSGRGVGMDIVKKSIENLRGSIDIDSERGLGTTITLRLPLTLAIIDGLLVQVDESYFVLPSAAVEECIELTNADVEESHGRQITKLRDQIIPYIRLREQFNIESNPPDVEQIVITEIESNRVGFVVDKVIGQHQTVIKNLSKIYKDVDAISGATIMADGTVALIIDINKHFQSVEKEYQAYYGGL